MAGLTAPAGTGGGNIDLLFRQKCQHGLALDAHLAEVQHFGHRVRRGVDDHLREGCQPLAQALVQRTHRRIAALHGLGKAGGSRRQTQRIGQVLGAGAQPALLLAAEVGRLERLHKAVAEVERTNALGGVDLVPADRQRVDIRQLDGDAHPRLHRVHMDDGAAVAALDLCRQPLHIVAGADLVIDHHAGDQNGVLAHMLQHGVDVQRAVRTGLDDRDLVPLLCQLFQRLLHTGVLKAGHHDPLAEGPGMCRAQQRQIVALGSAGGEIQLPRLAAQRARHRSAGRVERLLTACAGGIQAGRVCPVLPHRLVDNIRHVRCDHRCRGVVQIM